MINMIFRHDTNTKERGNTRTESSITPKAHFINHNKTPPHTNYKPHYLPQCQTIMTKNQKTNSIDTDI